MGALKKLIIENNLPPATIKFGEEEVKEVKDTEGNILWGKYEVNTEQLDMYSDTYDAYFTYKYFNTSASNGNYSAVGVPESRTLNITNAANSNPCYYGETLNYLINVPLEYYLSTEGGRWVRSQSYSNTISSDLTLQPPSHTSAVSSNLISVTASIPESSTSTNTSTLRRTASPVQGAGTGAVTLPTNAYYNDVFAATWTHSLTDVVPTSGKTYYLQLENKGNNWTNTNASYLTYANYSTSVNVPVTTPIYFYSTPTWTVQPVSNLEGGGTGTGYRLDSTLGLNPLARQELDSLFLNFYCSSGGQHVDIGSTATPLTAGTFGKVSKAWNIYGTSWNTLTNTGWVDAQKGHPLNNISLLRVTRPAYWSGSPDGENQYNYPLAKSSLFAVYSWRDTFWKLDFYYGSNTKVTTTASITNPGSAYLEVDYNLGDLLSIHFPTVTISAPLSYVCGKITATATLLLRDSNGSDIDEAIIETKTINFSNLAVGVTIFNTDHTEVDTSVINYNDINSEWDGVLYFDYTIELDNGLKHVGSTITKSMGTVTIIERE